MKKIKIYNNLNFNKEFYYEGADGWCIDEIGNKYFFKDSFVDFISEEEPSVISINGTKEWFKKGKKHRETGPAIMGLGFETWYFNGLKHKIDGFATINYHDSWCNEYWIKGIRLNKYDYDSLPKDDNGKIHSDELIQLLNLNFYCWHGNFCENEEDFMFLKLNNEFKEIKHKSKFKI